jgi:hypothetical protein
LVLEVLGEQLIAGQREMTQYLALLPQQEVDWALELPFKALLLLVEMAVLVVVVLQMV